MAPIPISTTPFAISPSPSPYPSTPSSDASDNSLPHTPLSFSTRAIHVGSHPDETTGAVIPAISLSTTYRQKAVGVHQGFEYSRSGNPNRNAFEALIASLEAPRKLVNPIWTGDATSADLPPANEQGGLIETYALAFSSGSAVTAAIMNSLEPGSHVVSVNDVYGGTYRYLKRVASASQGTQVDLVDLQGDGLSPAKVERVIREAVKEETKLLWIESPTNPTLRLIDLESVSRAAKAINPNIVIVVDNTFATPFYQKPLERGADVAVHSVTKYLNGHSDVVMGALATASPQLFSRFQFLQNAMGAVPSSFDSWLAHRGAKTLPLRMRQHGLNALKIARFLELESQREDGYVESVEYPGLESHKLNGLAWKQMEGTEGRKVTETLKEVVGSSGRHPDLEGGFPYTGMVSFRIRDRRKGVSEDDESAAERFLRRTKIFTLAESLGGVESLAELPSKMTHGGIPHAERQALGITDSLVRLSVGVEDANDLIADLRQALRFAVEE